MIKAAACRVLARIHHWSEHSPARGTREDRADRCPVFIGVVPSPSGGALVRRNIVPYSAPPWASQQGHIASEARGTASRDTGHSRRLRVSRRMSAAGAGQPGREAPPSSRSSRIQGRGKVAPQWSGPARRETRGGGGWGEGGAGGGGGGAA